MTSIFHALLRGFSTTRAALDVGMSVNSDIETQEDLTSKYGSVADAYVSDQNGHPSGPNIIFPCKVETCSTPDQDIAKNMLADAKEKLRVAETEVARVKRPETRNAAADPKGARSPSHE